MLSRSRNVVGVAVFILIFLFIATIRNPPPLPQSQLDQDQQQKKEVSAAPCATPSAAPCAPCAAPSAAPCATPSAAPCAGHEPKMFDPFFMRREAVLSDQKNGHPFRSDSNPPAPGFKLFLDGLNFDMAAPGRPAEAGPFARVMMVGDSNFRKILENLAVSSVGNPPFKAVLNCEGEATSQAKAIAAGKPAARWHDSIILYYTDAARTRGVLITFRFHSGEMHRINKAFTTEARVPATSFHGDNFVDNCTVTSAWEPELPANAAVPDTLLNFFDLILYFPSLWGAEKYADPKHHDEFIGQFERLNTLATSGRVMSTGPLGMPGVLVVPHFSVGYHPRFSPKELAILSELLRRRSKEKNFSFSILRMDPLIEEAIKHEDRSKNKEMYNYEDYHASTYTAGKILLAAASFLRMVRGMALLP